MITVRWCAGFLFFLALVPAWMGVRDWFLALFLFAAFVVAFTPWHRLVADLPAGHPESVSRLDDLDGIGRAPEFVDLWDDSPSPSDPPRHRR